MRLLDLRPSALIFVCKSIFDKVYLPPMPSALLLGSQLRERFLNICLKQKNNPSVK